MSAMVSLIASLRHKRQLAGLGVIAGLALSSDSAARKLLSPEVLSCLQVPSCHACFCPGCKRDLLSDEGGPFLNGAHLLLEGCCDSRHWAAPSFLTFWASFFLPSDVGHP